MAKAVICPVCGGTGKYKKAFSTEEEKTCHGCNSKGWVEVADDYYWYPSYPYYPYPSPPYYPETPTYPTYPNPYPIWTC